MEKATLIIATLVCLFVVVAEMPNASIAQIALVKGVALALVALFSKRLEKILPNEEV